MAFVSWIKDGAVGGVTDDAFPVTRVAVSVPPLGASLLSRGRAYGEVTRSLEHAILAARPDLLIPHDLFVLRAAVRVKARTGVPLLYDCHENWPVLVAQNSRVEALLTTIQERRLTRKVDHLLIPCEPVAQKFRRRGIPTTVVYNARPSREIRPARRDESRRAHGFEPSDFVIGFAGALGKDRGLEELLAAISHLPSEVKVLIVGGPKEDADALWARTLQLGLRDRVRISAYLPFTQLSSYYAAMDLGIIVLRPTPNNLTATPNKLFDYMGHGVALLVSDYLVMGPIVREYGCGWTVPDLRSDTLARVIQEARRSGESGARGERGRQAYLQHFAWERQETTLLDIVSGLKPAQRPATR